MLELELAMLLQAFVHSPVNVLLSMLPSMWCFASTYLWPARRYMCLTNTASLREPPTNLMYTFPWLQTKGSSASSEPSISLCNALFLAPPCQDMLATFLGGSTV